MLSGDATVCVETEYIQIIHYFLMNTWSKAQDALLVQWGICFGPGGWDLLAPIVGCRSEECFNTRLVVVLFIDVDTMNFVQNTSPVFCSHAIKQGSYVLRCRK